MTLLEVCNAAGVAVILANAATTEVVLPSVSGLLYFLFGIRGVANVDIHDDLRFIVDDTVKTGVNSTFGINVVNSASIHEYTFVPDVRREHKRD